MCRDWDCTPRSCAPLVRFPHSSSSGWWIPLLIPSSGGSPLRPWHRARDRTCGGWLVPSSLLLQWCWFLLLVVSKSAQCGFSQPSSPILPWGFIHGISSCSPLGLMYCFTLSCKKVGFLVYKLKKSPCKEFSVIFFWGNGGPNWVKDVDLWYQTKRKKCGCCLLSSYSFIRQIFGVQMPFVPKALSWELSPLEWWISSSLTLHDLNFAWSLRKERLQHVAFSRGFNAFFKFEF